MIKIYPNTKIFVHCPAGIATGGAELLHQLVDLLNNNHRDAYIVYFGKDPHVLPEDYKCYNIKIVDHIEDDSSNIEIIYEGVFDFVRERKNTQKFLWWLSVDNFYLCSQHYLAVSDLMQYNYSLGFITGAKRLVKSLRDRKNYFAKPITLKYLKSLDVTHGYQSEYAQNFLQNKGFKEIYALKDYINVEHLEQGPIDKKEDIILYNPKKGLRFTRRLIEQSSDLKWVPIANMRREEVADIMRRAKLYVDFGYHPGKDRLPRECAAHSCCIITGMKGSSAFFEDIMIPNKYKYKDCKKNMPKIVAMIRWILQNYDTAINDFRLYRTMIKSEKEEFERQVRMFFL